MILFGEKPNHGFGYGVGKASGVNWEFVFSTELFVCVIRFGVGRDKQIMRNATAVVFAERVLFESESRWS